MAAATARAATPPRRRAAHPAAATAALASGLLASSCCVLQLALNAASIGCAGFSALTPYRPLFRALMAASLAALAARQGLTDRRTLATAAAALALAASSDVLAAVNRRPPPPSPSGAAATAVASSFTQQLPPMLLLPPLVALPLRRALAPGLQLLGPPGDFLRAYLDASLSPSLPPSDAAADVGGTTTPFPRRVALRVKGVRCEACAARVRGALLSAPVPGGGAVLNATVDIDKGEAVVYVVAQEEKEGDDDEVGRRLVEAVEGLRAGYEAEEAEAGGG